MVVRACDPDVIHICDAIRNPSDGLIDNALEYGRRIAL